MKVIVGSKFIHTSCKRMAVVTAITDGDVSFQYEQSLGGTGLFRRGVKTTQVFSKENFSRWFKPEKRST